MFYMVEKAAVPSAFSLQSSAWFRPIPIPIPIPIRAWTLNPSTCPTCLHGWKGGSSFSLQSSAFSL